MTKQEVETAVLTVAKEINMAGYIFLELQKKTLKEVVEFILVKHVLNGDLNEFLNGGKIHDSLNKLISYLKQACSKGYYNFEYEY